MPLTPGFTSQTLLKKSDSKPRCPYCGSSDYVLMPTDFETAKCKACGRNWNHGIVPGINDPGDVSYVLKYNHNHDMKGKFSSKGTPLLDAYTQAGGLTTKSKRIRTTTVGQTWVEQHQEKPDPNEGKPGSRSNPIHCKADIAKAAKLISEGKHVTLSQPEQVATLVEKIKKDILAATAAGVKPPIFNLAAISVRGTNLFAQDNLRVPRVHMPQFSGKPDPGSKAEAVMSHEAAQPPTPNRKEGEVDLTQHFLEALTKAGVKSKEVTLPASHLRATQSQIDGEKIAKMVDAMDAGTVKEDTITVTRDGYVLDGHHRWASTIVRDLRDNKPGDLKMRVIMLDIDIGTALSLGRAFQEEWGLPSGSLDSRAKKIDARLRKILQGGPFERVA